MLCEKNPDKVEWSLLSSSVESLFYDNSKLTTLYALLHNHIISVCIYIKYNI